MYWSPELAITRQPGKIVIIWPTGDPSLVVEATDNLNPPIQWSPVTNATVVVDDQNLVEIRIDATLRFCRLTKP